MKRLRSRPRQPSRTESSTLRIRERFGLSREKFGRLSGFSTRSLANWESGASRPGDQARMRLTELDRLRVALARVIDPATLGTWLETPNAAFGGLKPLEVVERGEIDRLWRMAFELEAGEPS